LFIDKKELTCLVENQSTVTSLLLTH
jgi:hypothetical protein